MEQEYIDVKIIMEKPSFFLDERQQLGDIIALFPRNSVSVAPVVNKEKKLTGELSINTILSEFSKENDLTKPVFTLMNKDIKVVDDSKAVLLSELIDYNGHVYVCRDGKLEGIITAQTIVNMYNWQDKLKSRLESKNSEYKMVFDHCYDSIYNIDRDGTVLMANAATSKIIGKLPEEIVGKNIREMESEMVYFPSVFNMAVKNKRPVTILQNCKDDMQVVVTGVPVLNEKGEITRVVASTRDIESLVKQIDEHGMAGMQALLEQLQNKTELADKYFNELRQLRMERNEEKRIKTHNREMGNVLELVKKVAPVDSNVLILGESGVGKDLVANMIHNLSARKLKPFVKVNCGAIPENILESELFGYEAGAFTGAQKDGKTGLFEIANEGTIFLNEISELPLNLQVKILHVIQEKSFIRVGGNQQIRVDVRILSASNQNLQDMTRAGTFRKDLFYRLNVIPILIPPLRERKEDIPDLVMTFLDGFNKKYNRSKQLDPMTMRLLLRYDWPGNVRELENMMERVLVVSCDETIYPNDLPYEVSYFAKKTEKINLYEEGASLQEVLEKVEKQVLEEVHEKYKAIKKVAEALDVDQSTIARKFKKYGI